MLPQPLPLTPAPYCTNEEAEVQSEPLAAQERVHRREGRSGCAADARAYSPLFQLGPLKLRGMDLPQDTGWDSGALSSTLWGQGAFRRQLLLPAGSWQRAPEIGLDRHL